MTRAAVALALLGVGIAGYLTLVHLTGLEPVCTGGAGGSGCERVQTSEYSELLGVPVALLGLLGYLGILVALRIPGEGGVLGPAVLAVLGAVFSGYLQYRSIVDVEATCAWCVASAVTMTGLAVVTVTRALR